MGRRMALAAFVAISSFLVGGSGSTGEEVMETDWRLQPHVGVGRLQFGLTPEGVADTAEVYGSPTPMIRGSDALSDIEGMLAAVGSSIPEDAIVAMRQAAEDQAGLDRQNLEADGVPVLLEYRDGLLDGVTVEARHEEAWFDGERIFSIEARDVLRLFEKANGAPGRYRSNEAAFDRLAVSLFAFSEVDGDDVRVTTTDDEDYGRRSVMLRRQAYAPAGELDQFIAASFR